MRIMQKNRDGIAILALQGKLVVPSEAALHRAVREALAVGARRILVDLAGVRQIDSGGIGELVRTYRVAAECNGSIKVCSLRPKVLDIVQMTELHQVFEILADEDAGIAAFQREPLRVATPESSVG